ncbi:MAG: hypothetical protein AAE985_06855 [Thermoplasmataceae archaeon]|jgi:hypothetical protein
MKFKNLYHTYSESFIIKKSPNQAQTMIESGFNVTDIASRLEELVDKNDNYRQEFIKEFKQKIKEKLFEPLNLDDQSAMKLLNLFNEVATEISLTEYHEKIIESKFLKGNFKTLSRETINNFDIYQQIFGIYYMLNTLRLYKANGIKRSARFVLPSIESRITLQLNNDKNRKEINALITPIFTIWNLYKFENKWPQETFATISFITVFKQEFFDISIINDLMNSLENNSFKKVHINMVLSSDYEEFYMKAGELATYDKLIESFCKLLTKLLDIHDQDIKRIDDVINTGNVGPILKDDGTKISIPDLDCTESINDENNLELLQAIHHLSISVRDENGSKTDEHCALFSIKKMKVTWAVDFLNVYSKRARRLLGFASFDDNFPYRSYSRLVLSNLTRAENISAQIMILKNLNILMIENTNSSKLLSTIKNQINNLDILFNLDTTEDFLYDDIKRLQNMTEINGAFERISWKTELFSSLLFDEVQIKYSRNQKLTNSLLLVLTILLVFFTLFSLKII